MVKAIRDLTITTIALIGFLFIADAIVWDCRTWECMCTNDECGWCATPKSVTYYDPNEEFEYPTYSIKGDEELEWELYRSEARAEYADAFTALFNSYETKRTKNGRVMIRQGNSGSFKFAKKG